MLRQACVCTSLWFCTDELVYIHAFSCVQTSLRTYMFVPRSCGTRLASGGWTQTVETIPRGPHNRPPRRLSWLPLTPLTPGRGPELVSHNHQDLGWLFKILLNVRNLFKEKKCILDNLIVNFLRLVRKMCQFWRLFLQNWIVQFAYASSCQVTYHTTDSKNRPTQMFCLSPA